VFYLIMHSEALGLNMTKKPDTNGGDWGLSNFFHFIAYFIAFSSPFSVSMMNRKDLWAQHYCNNLKLYSFNMVHCVSSVAIVIKLKENKVTNFQKKIILRLILPWEFRWMEIQMKHFLCLTQKVQKTISHRNTRQQHLLWLPLHLAIYTFVCLRRLQRVADG